VATADPSATTAPTTPATGGTPKTTTAGTTTAKTGHASLRKVDWRNASLTLPRLASDGPACRGGAVKFKNGVAVTSNSRYQVLPGDDRAEYGDINGDRREDALLHVYCGPTGREASDWLVAMKSTAQGKPAPLGAIEPDGGYWFTGYDVHSTGMVLAELTDIPGSRTQSQRFGWNGHAFYRLGDDDHQQRVDATNYDWSRATLTIPFRGATATVQPNDRTCPRKTVTFTNAGTDQGAVQSGRCEYWIHKITNADLNRDGTPDALVRITATAIGGGTLSTGNIWYFGYTIRDGKPALLGFVTTAELPSQADTGSREIYSNWAVASTGTVKVAQRFTLPGRPQQTLTRTFRWHGAGFTPSQSAPHPRTDIAP
jgi:hypothetical protein